MEIEYDLAYLFVLRLEWFDFLSDPGRRFASRDGQFAEDRAFWWKEKSSMQVKTKIIPITPVSAIALIYAEPRTEQADADREASHDDAGFSMGFAAKIKPLDLNPAMIRPLLGRTREILDLAAPPPARRGCKDCAKLAGLIGLLEGRNDAGKA